VVHVGPRAPATPSWWRSTPPSRGPPRSPISTTPIRTAMTSPFLLGMIRYAIEKSGTTRNTLKLTPHAPYVIARQVQLRRGDYSRDSNRQGRVRQTSWGYEADEVHRLPGRSPAPARALRVPVLKKHVDRYTRRWSSGLRHSEGTFLKVAELRHPTGNAPKAARSPTRSADASHSRPRLQIDSARRGDVEASARQTVGARWRVTPSVATRTSGATRHAGTFEICRLSQVRRQRHARPGPVLRGTAVPTTLTSKSGPR